MGTFLVLLSAATCPVGSGRLELLQETWLKLFRSLGSLRDPQALPAFLYITARNTAISRLRKRELQDSESYANEAHDESAGNDISAFDNAEEVHHALDQLPLLQREALTLYFLKDLSLDEMAAYARRAGRNCQVATSLREVSHAKDFDTCCHSEVLRGIWPDPSEYPRGDINRRPFS